MTKVNIKVKFVLEKKNLIHATKESKFDNKLKAEEPNLKPAERKNIVDHFKNIKENI